MPAKMLVRRALLCGGIGAAAGFGAAALLWRTRRPVVPAEPVDPQSAAPAPLRAPPPPGPPPAPEAQRTSSGAANGRGDFAPGYLGPAKAEVEQIKDSAERNYARGYANAVFAGGGIVINLPYGSAEKYYQDPYQHGHDDGIAARPPRYSNAVTLASFKAAPSALRNGVNVLFL